MPDGVSAQHGHLTASIQQLRYLYAAGVGWAEISVVLDRMIDDVRLHFDHEETEMYRGGYPRLEEHRQLHITFLGRLAALRSECERRQTELLGVLLELLESWLRGHESTADRDAMEFLKIE